jgi:hypothetical protein
MEIGFEFASKRISYNGARHKVVIAWFGTDGIAVKLADAARVAADLTTGTAERTLDGLAGVVGAGPVDASRYALELQAMCREAIGWRPAGPIKRDRAMVVRRGIYRGIA